MASSVQETQALQRRALSEIARLTKPGGHVIFEEEVNEVQTFSRLVYYLSRFSNERGLR